MNVILFLRAPADISLILEHYSPIPAAGIELSHEALKAAASDNIPVSEDEANLSKQRLKYNIPKFQRFQILRWFVSLKLYIAVYVRHRKEKSEKKYMYKGKKIKRQQFKTFGTLTVFQLWSIRGISICLLVLWHGQINTMEFLKCCKRSHFTKAKFTELSFRIGICVRQRYGTEAIGRVQFLSWKYTIRRLITRNCGVSFCKDT